LATGRVRPSAAWRWPAEDAVEVFAPDLKLVQLELVMKVANKYSTDFRIGTDARIVMA
jgi:hypothetical protein